MFIEGNPAPTFKFFKGGTEITEGGRYKLISDGENNNMIMLTIAKVKATDEAEYRVYIENCHGSDEKNFMLYVSGKTSFLISHLNMLFLGNVILLFISDHPISNAISFKGKTNVYK